MSILSQFRQKQIDAAGSAMGRHDVILTHYLDCLESEPPSASPDRRITVLARSPASPVLRALFDRMDALEIRGILVEAIIAQLDPNEDLQTLIDLSSRLSRGSDLPDLIRWAKNPSLLEAHEQITLGSEMCWSGDTMRREPGKRDSLDLFEPNSPHTVRIALVAFDAIWHASATIPSSQIRAGKRAKPTATYEQQPDATIPKPFFLRTKERLLSTRH